MMTIREKSVLPYLQEYRGKFDAGWDEVGRCRLSYQTHVECAYE